MNTSLRTDFDKFLFASLGEDASGTPLTVLSALARFGVDPWEEAVSLAHLPAVPANQRLDLLLAAVPSLPAPGAGRASFITHLLALLHSPAAPKMRASASAPREGKTAPARRVNVAIYWLIGLVLMVIAQWALSAQPGQRQSRISGISSPCLQI